MNFIAGIFHKMFEGYVTKVSSLFIDIRTFSTCGEPSYFYFVRLIIPAYFETCSVPLQWR